jgi:surfeit locus 1 family protein
MALFSSGFDFRPRLYPTLAFLLLFPLLISLGLWQLNRAGEKKALLQARQERQQELPVDLNLVRGIGMQDRFRPATVRGHFVPGQQWLQDNRVREGQVGYHVYSLFEPDDATGWDILVNRGWVPVGVSRQQLPQLPLPIGDLRLTGHLNTPASVGITLGKVDYRGAGLSVLPYLQLHALGEAIGHKVLDLALVLDAGEPGVLTPDKLPTSRMGPERHLGYAVQWFALATALLMIYVGVNVRRVSQEEKSLS